MSDKWLGKLREPTPWQAPDPRPGPVVVDGLEVRLYREGDGPRLFAAVSANRDALLPWMVWVTTDHLHVDHSIFYVERMRRGVEKPDCLDFPMGIFDAKSGEQLGGTGFHRIHPEWRDAEIGYWVRGDRQRSGICTRAMGALISSGLRSAADGGWGFRRIVIQCAEANTGSRRVCERLGLRLEGRYRADRYTEPLGYHDNLAYAVLADEWDFAQNHAKPNIARP
ncbi:MAG: GNAT family N-acetyltransferase [Myxococcales bacterium]|nr:GNAT family N-acetyltransferase [Myxococcales bacterium]